MVVVVVVLVRDKTVIDRRVRKPKESCTFLSGPENQAAVDRLYSRCTIAQRQGKERGEGLCHGSHRKESVKDCVKLYGVALATGATEVICSKNQRETQDGLHSKKAFFSCCVLSCFELSFGEI